MARLRMGVAGTGHWADVVHAAGAAAHPDVELVGVWGRDLAKADAVAARHGTRGYDDFDALLETVDLMTFALPPHVQAELAVRAAEAGKHLLLEKPIATDLDAADRLVDAAEQAGVSTVVFFTQRFVPQWDEWVERMRAGEMLGGRAEWLANNYGPDSPYAASAWRLEEGALWDVGPHALSHLLPVLGPVASVTGSRGAGDLVHLVLNHEGGAVSVMSLCLTMPPAASRVAVEMFDESGWHVRPDLARDTDAAYRNALSELLANASAGETRHRCDVRFGRDVVDVLSRCQQVLGAPRP